MLNFEGAMNGQISSLICLTLKTRWLSDISFWRKIISSANHLHTSQQTTPLKYLNSGLILYLLVKTPSRLESLSSALRLISVWICPQHDEGGGLRAWLCFILAYVNLSKKFGKPSLRFLKIKNDKSSFPFPHFEFEQLSFSFIQIFKNCTGFVLHLIYSYLFHNSFQ